jgi:diaminopropionate ammonia-lyase
VKNDAKIEWVFNNYQAKERTALDHLNSAKAEEIIEFHRSFPMYEETPLVALKGLAEELSINNLYVKDESKRFGLNAFKVLGGSYASAVYLAEKYTSGILGYDDLKKFDFEDDKILFVTATDGNHGRGIAWTAKQLGFEAVVFMPKGSSLHRIENIKREGARVEVLDCNYDDAVRYAKKYADENNGILMQDTAMDGYNDIPLWVMQGYMTIAHEIKVQLKGTKPTHLILQAGVGSFAAAILGYFKNLYGDDVKAIIMEPEKANCIYKSAMINDGEPHAVTGDLETIMAGLSCGEPNPIAWPILRDYGDLFVSCPDYIAEEGMKLLANPKGCDEKVVSGESGAPGLGLINSIMKSEGLNEIKQNLDIGMDSNVIVISTEGDTDPTSYNKIISGL